MTIFNAQAVTPSASRVTWRTMRVVWITALIAAVLLLALVNLPYAPRTWFDEGSHLHVPKTLLQHGVYADISSEGFRYYGPTVGVGPTVLLPIALVFKLAGIGLIQGRIVIVAYLFATLMACFAFARRLGGTTTALLAVTLLLASRTLSQQGAIEYGRQVLGEIPGIAFLFGGALAWHMAFSRSHGKRFWYALAAGLGFGLALVTKNQFALIIPPTLFIVALLDWRYYRVGDWIARLVPLIVACGCFGLWMLAQLLFLGPGSFAENLQLTRQAAGGAIFVFNARAVLRAFVYLVRPDLYGGLLLPALALTAWQARRRSLEGLTQTLLALLIGLWLIWFVGASLGWPRYAFPAIAFGAVIIAQMVVYGVRRLQGGSRVRRWLARAVLAYMALAVAVPITVSARAILQPDSSAEQMAAYLQEHIPTTAIVETWEPELGLLTNHRYHYPPIQLLDTAVRHEWLGGPPLVYDGLSDRPMYVVVGSFGAYTGVYPGDVLERDYTVERQYHEYVLYRRK